MRSGNMYASLGLCSTWWSSGLIECPVSVDHVGWEWVRASLLLSLPKSTQLSHLNGNLFLFFFFNIYQLLSAEVTERNIQRATSNKGQTESLSVNPGGGHLNASNSVWHPRANWRMEPYTLTIFFWCIPVWITWFFPDTHLSKDFLGVL